MKNSIFLLFSLLAISCSKERDYECTCTATTDDGQVVGTTTRTFDGWLEEDAEAECERWEGTTEFPFATAHQDCVLKEI